jgi:hypothetical protein
MIICLSKTQQTSCFALLLSYAHCFAPFGCRTIHQARDNRNVSGYRPPLPNTIS